MHRVSTALLRGLTACLACVALTTLGLGMSPARADTITNPVPIAAAALRGASVYVEPGADVLSSADVDAVKQAIAASATPELIHIAVLDEKAGASVGGDANLPAAIGTALGRSGAIGVVTPKGFYAAGRGLPTGEAGRLAEQAIQSHKNQKRAIVVAFVQSVAQAFQQEQGTRTTGTRTAPGRTYTTSTPQRSGHTGLYIFLILIALILGGIAIVFGIKSKRQKEAEAAELASARANVQSDIQTLENDLSINCPAGKINPQTDEEKAYATAWSRHDAAVNELATVNSTADLERVSLLVNQGRAALQSGLGIKSGKPAPAEVFKTAAELAKAGKAPNPGSRQDAPPRNAPLIGVTTYQPYTMYDYPGYGYGWYPGYGYGYWGYNGGFIGGLIAGEMLMGGGYGWGMGYGYDTMWSDSYYNYGGGYGEYGGDYDGGYGGDYDGGYDGGGGGDFDGGGYDGGGGGGFDGGGYDSGGGGFDTGSYDSGGGGDWGGGGFDSGGGGDFGGGGGDF